MTQHKIIIDTDPGIDDAMALHHAFADERLDVIGLTTVFGNVPVKTATRNALHLCELAAIEIPVAEGAATPMTITPNPHADFVHGVEGFGDYPPRTPAREKDARSAAEFLCEVTKANPGEITICAVGPLTNLALALEHDPEIAKNAKNVVIMGGAVEAPGNVTPFAEANIWNDPHAAQLVFDADWDVTLVGLDVTHSVSCNMDDFRDVTKSAPEIGKFLEQVSEYYIKFYTENVGVDGCYLHDPAAVIAITDPEFFEVKEAPLNTILEGEQVGNTIADPARNGRPVKICLEVNDQGVKDTFLSTLKKADARRDARRG